MKTEFKGELKRFPVEVVEKMLERQVEQGNPKDVSVFEKNRTEDKSEGGFDWWVTPEGDDFWYMVIDMEDFDFFFKRYPRNQGMKETMTTAKRIILEELEEQFHPVRVEDVIFWALEHYANSKPEMSWGRIVAFSIKERIREEELEPWEKIKL